MHCKAVRQINSLSAVNDPASSTLLYPVDKDFRYDYIFVALRRPSSPFVALRRPSSPFVTLRRPSSPKLAALLLMAAAPFVLAGSASAQVFKITTTGTITSIYDTTGFFNSSVQVGTPFTYSYLYDYSVPDTYADPTFGLYVETGAPYGGTFTFGDYGLVSNANSSAEINVYDNNPTSADAIVLFDKYGTATGFSSPPLQTEVVASGILTNDSILSSDALPPLSVYNLANFHKNGNGFYVTAILNGDFGAAEASGTATSLSAELVTPAAVPEASTTVSLGVLLALGGLTLAVRRRRVAAGK